MRRASVLSAACLLITAAGSQNAAAPTGGDAEFEIQVGARVFPARVNQPLAVTTPRGERVTLVLRRRDVLRYGGADVAFLYPRQLQLSRTEEGGVATITAEGVDSTIVLIQSYPPGHAGAQAVRARLVEGLREQFQARGGRVAASRSMRRSFNGVEREGVLLEVELAGSRVRCEVHAFPKGERATAVVFQHTAEDEVRARRAFAIIADSLK